MLVELVPSDPLTLLLVKAAVATPVSSLKVLAVKHAIAHVLLALKQVLVHVSLALAHEYFSMVPVHLLPQVRVWQEHSGQLQELV